MKSFRAADGAVSEGIGIYRLVELEREMKLRAHHQSIQSTPTGWKTDGW
jgi:hypothetical protein